MGCMGGIDSQYVIWLNNVLEFGALKLQPFKILLYRYMHILCESITN